MTIGKVRWFNDQKGFGFIIPDGDPAKDVFVHAKELANCGIHPSKMLPNLSVSFTIKEGPKGFFATDLKIP